MNDAAQIRCCNGALRASPSLLQIQNPKFSNQEPLSNRESLRLEKHPFQITTKKSKSTVCGGRQLHSQIPNFQPSHKAKSIKKHPQSLFRLESTPTLCFLQLTRILIEPMFRLERQKTNLEICQTAGIKSPTPNLKPKIYATITAGPPQPARRESRKAQWQ
jgi:hypothetical protein